MIVSQEKIRRIREIVEKHFNALVFRAAGRDALSEAEVKKLLDDGAITEDMIPLLEEAYYIGRVRNPEHPRDRAGMTLETFRREHKDKVAPESDAEKYSLEHVRQSGGNFIVKLRDFTKNTITDIIQRENLDYRNRVLTETVRPVLETGIAEEQTLGEIAMNLRDATGDLFRDWKRVATTEMAHAMNLGETDAIVTRNPGKSAEEIYVYKVVNRDSATCEHCKRLYLMPDGVTPRVFRLSQMQDAGHNYGRKASEYQATIGPVHPWCRCSLVEIPAGWGFGDGGKLAYRGVGHSQYHQQNKEK